MTDIAKALESLGAKANVRGDTWDGVEFLPGSIRPTEKEVMDEIVRLQSIPEDEKRIDAAFPQTDVARVLFEAIFELANRVKALEDGNTDNPYTRAQVRGWLKAKLP